MVISTNGKIAHIDFGDSFEAAMQRENVPEKVPFRLTRNMVKAMEVTGVNGTYRLVFDKNDLEKLPRNDQSEPRKPKKGQFAVIR